MCKTYIEAKMVEHTRILIHHIPLKHTFNK